MKNLLKQLTFVWSRLPGWCEIQKTGAVKLIVALLAFAMINLTIGCRNYFKITSSPNSSEKISDLNQSGKSIIVHYNNSKWTLIDVEVKNNEVSGIIKDYNMTPTLKPVRPNRSNRYLTRASHNQRFLLNEVHLYLNELAVNYNTRISIPLTAITRIDIYDKDTGATAGSWFAGILGGTVAFVGVAVVIIALTKESCPFIYTWDGENYDYAGEIYSGSIHKPLERNDYLKLPTYPGQESYSLKISNEAQEIQHTNLLELLVIDHAQNTKVLVDKYGRTATMQNPVTPLKATNLAGEDVTAMVSSKDNLFYQSSSAVPDPPLKDGVIMEFPGQGDAKTAKLVINAKNSILLDLMLGQFYDLFGSAFKRYMKKQEKASASVLQQWTLDQDIPLKLYIERGGQWEFVDYYNIAGPMKFKDDVLSIPLKGNETYPLRVKLEFGNLLWEIDYAAIDYSPEQPLTIRELPVKTAVSEVQKNVAGLLVRDDIKYCNQPTTENQAVVTFDLPGQTEQARTVILHSKGWYQVLRNPSGKPDIEYLKTFRQPGRFNQFVNEQVRKMEQLVSRAE
jgi:hypothetical protein